MFVKMVASKRRQKDLRVIDHMQLIKLHVIVHTRVNFESDSLSLIPERCCLRFLEIITLTSRA